MKQKYLLKCSTLFLDVDECVDNAHNCNWTTHFCVNTQGGYMCEEKSGSSDCAAGYKFSIQQQKCIGMYSCGVINACEATYPTQQCILSRLVYSSVVLVIRLVYPSLYLKDITSITEKSYCCIWCVLCLWITCFTFVSWEYVFACGDKCFFCCFYNR